MRKILLSFITFAALVSPARADFTAKDAAAATITFKNANTCSSAVCIPQTALTDSTGVNFVVVTTAGADGVSNTSNGLLGYSRMLQFNGTTWDRWQGIVKISSGGVAAGALAAGAGVDGWDLTQGSTTDAAATAGSTGTLSAKLRLMTTQLNTINTTLGSPLQAGGNVAVTASTPEGTLADAPATLPATTTNASIIALLKALANVGQYPSGAVATNGTNTGTTTAISTTLAATVSVTQYACWISVRSNATAVATGNVTLSDGTKTFNFTHITLPNASGVGITEQVFPLCIPATAANTAWTLTSPTPGAGGVVSVSIGGYKL